ncbi:MAG TPA: glutamate racemase [Patescibacteria group bacterium]|nr:glutamate racemase [Patescibacteria group bacterium]
MQQIGVIDSGLGGLTIWQEIVKLMPDLATIYIADSKNTPYGTKSAEEIISLTCRLVRFLDQLDVRTIVVACNTMSVTALPTLRREFPQITFVGTVPAVKTAVKVSKSKKIGILTTKRTEESAYLADLIHQFAKGCEVTVVGTNRLVPLIEEGQIESEKMHELLVEELLPFREAEIDALVLGCTHYPFLKKLISQILPGVLLIDSSEAVARQTRRVVSLEQRGLRKEKEEKHVFYTSGETSDLRNMIYELGRPKNFQFQIFNFPACRQAGSESKMINV